MLQAVVTLTSGHLRRRVRVTPATVPPLRLAVDESLLVEVLVSLLLSQLDDSDHPAGLDVDIRVDVRDTRAVIEIHDVTVVLPPHRQDAAVQLDRKIELARIVGKVIRHLVPHRIPVRVAREREARKRVVAGRSEQFERVPALTPRRRGLSGGLKDREIATLLGEEVADGEACLAAADDDYVAMLRDGARHDVLI